MVALTRALTYAAVFVGIVLVLLPSRLLKWFGATRPLTLSVIEFGAGIVVLLGAALVLWCVLTFAIVGRGTPAPFDPPRHLVLSGPYRFVRNPMYEGAGLVLAGTALLYRSLPLLGCTLMFLIVAHAFVRCYEEPRLRRLFEPEYEAYCKRVHRWRPVGR